MNRTAAEPGVAGQAARGVISLSSARVARLLIQFATSIVLARLLLPEVFGRFAMVTILTNLAPVIGALGFSTALIQRERLEPGLVSSVFWTNLAIGATAGAALFLAAPLVGRFFGDPSLVPVTRWMAAIFPLSALGFSHSAVLARDLRFGVLASIEVAGVAVAGVAAIVAAASGWRVGSLVLLSLAAVTLESCGYIASSRFRPGLRLRIRDLRELIPFSAPLLASTLLNYGARNADNLLIGRFVGPVELGLYSRAYNFMTLPVTQVTSLVGRVLVPALSRSRADPAAGARLYLTTLRAVALVTFPMMAGLFVVAEDFVRALLGEPWLGAVPILRIFCALGLAQSLGSTAGWLYVSQGRTGLMLRWVVFATGVLLVAFAVGLSRGAVGVAWAYFAASGALFLPSLAIPGRLIGLSVREILRPVAPVFLAAVLMAAVVAAIPLPIDAPALRLAARVAVGVVTYLLALRILGISAPAEIRDLVRTSRAAPAPGTNPVEL